MDRTNTEGAAWTHGNQVIAINPTRRKALERALMFTGAAVVFVLTVGFADDGPVQTWAKKLDQQAEVENYEVAMRRLADAGKPDAVIWLAKNRPDLAADRLDALIRAGSGEAAWTLARIKWETDKDEAKRLLELAAANGYLPAMKWADRQRNPSSR